MMRSPRVRFSVLGLLATMAVGLIVVRQRLDDRDNSVNGSTLPAPPVPSKIAAPIDRLTVEAVGREFGWQFRLLGLDGKSGTDDDVLLGDQLQLPVDCDVDVVLKSADYLYVFSVPKLKLREIAVPELTFHLRFRTAEDGKHDVLADPLCGVRLFHDEQMGTVTIQSQAEFRHWLETVAGNKK